MIVPRYAPGEWFAVVTDGSIALLAPTTAPSVVAEVWALLRAGAEVTEQLQPMLRPGIAAMPPFALLTIRGDTVHVVVRGDATVVVGRAEGEWRLTGGRASTWVEETVSGALTVTVAAPGTAAAERPFLPVLAAAVTAAAVEVVLADDVAPVQSVDAVQVATESVLEPVPAPAAEPEPAPVPEPEPSAAAPDGFPPPPPPVDLSDDLEHTVLTPETAPGTPSPEPPSLLDAAIDDHDGLTILTSDVAALRGQVPEWLDGTPAADPAPVTPPARITLSTGAVVSLGRPALIGRAPQISRVANDQLPHLVAVPSPNNDISRTHVQVRQDGEDVVITDLHSTNGVLVLREGTGPQRLHPGEPTAVEPGAVVDIGDGVTFTVEP